MVLGIKNKIPVYQIYKIKSKLWNHSFFSDPTLMGHQLGLFNVSYWIRSVLKIWIFENFGLEELRSKFYPKFLNCWIRSPGFHIELPGFQIRVFRFGRWPFWNFLIRTRNFEFFSRYIWFENLIFLHIRNHEIRIGYSKFWICAFSDRITRIIYFLNNLTINHIVIGSSYMHYQDWYLTEEIFLMKLCMKWMLQGRAWLELYQITIFAELYLMIRLEQLRRGLLNEIFRAR